MRWLLDQLLRQSITVGRLTVRWPGGNSTTYAARGPGSPVTVPGAGDRRGEAMIAIRDWATVRRLAVNPALTLGEAYMDGGIVPVDCSIYDILDVFMTNRSGEHYSSWVVDFRQALLLAKRRLSQFNPAARSRRNVAHHYDLNGRLYSLFLDRDRQYSCAYFRHGDETLEQAQTAKKRHIAAKLVLDRPDLEVLDIGCGWGGLALTLARDYGARVTGITLSTEQLAEAQARAAQEGLSDRVSFHLMDYRSLDRQFDRVVSVGMFEHVGISHYRMFFDVLRRCLEPDGVALLHSIGRSDGPSATNPWLAKYIFPGGYSPSMSEVMPAVERAGLVTTDVEILRLHYAETLRHWRRRFAANRDSIASLYDERFCRMFEFYLAGSELAFRREGHIVFQMQLARDQEAAPLTRDYIAAAESVPAMAATADA